MTPRHAGPLWPAGHWLPHAGRGQRGPQVGGFHPHPLCCPPTLGGCGHCSSPSTQPLQLAAPGGHAPVVPSALLGFTAAQADARCKAVIRARVRPVLDPRPQPLPAEPIAQVHPQEPGAAGRVRRSWERQECVWPRRAGARQLPSRTMHPAPSVGRSSCCPTGLHVCLGLTPLFCAVPAQPPDAWWAHPALLGFRPVPWGAPTISRRCLESPGHPALPLAQAPSAPTAPA